MARIFVADDDPHIREVVTFALGSAGHEISAFDGGKALLEASPEERAELVVLDIMMPDLDGIEVCRRLRASSTVPVLFLSAKDEEIDKIIGLEVGGDDYMTKPFSKRELQARVKAMLRRVAMVRREVIDESARPAKRRHGELVLDADRFEIEWRGEAIVLTVTEFGLLQSLMEHPGKVYTRGELVDRAYSFDNHVTERTIDTHVKRIRRKFRTKNQPIETVFGLGYRLASCQPD